ncbi:MAG: PIN domain-containing protein [bacterium]
MKILLDTCILIDFLRGKPKTIDLIRKLVEEDHELYTCGQIVSEITAGMRENEETATIPFLKALNFIALTFEDAELAGRIKYQQAQQGKTITLADATIASTAISHNLQLATENHKDFANIPNLQLFYHNP